jgi:phage/plasmid-associated DNA primase
LDAYGIQKSLKDLPKPDETKHLLPVAKGVLDLTTGELHPHEKHKDKMFMAILDTPYDPTAKAPPLFGGHAGLERWGP